MIGFRLMQVFPFIQLHLSGDRFERNGEFWPEVERAKSKFSVQLAELSEDPIGPADRFPLAALDGITQDAARTEEKRHGIEVAPELLLANLGDFLGERVQVQQLLHIE